MRRTGILLLVATAATAFTLVVSVTSAVSFAYHSPELHISIETAAALIALLAAQLFVARFRRTRDRADLVLAVALAVTATTNLAFSLIPALAAEERTGFATWAAIGGRLLGASLLAVAAFLPPRPVRQPARAAWRAFGAAGAALAVLACVMALVGDRLPLAIDPTLSPDRDTRPRVVGDPAVLTVQVIGMLLYAAAAAGFARRAARNDDRLVLWLAVASLLAAFARLNYFLFPSLYSDYFYAGDLLRMAFFGALLVGGAHELRAAQRAMGELAVLDERRRLSRELHDGMAQDLAYVVQQSRALASAPGPPAVAGELVRASEHALRDAREAIAAFSRPAHEPLAAALRRAAEEVAGRAGVDVEVDVPEGVEVGEQEREALLRITREAVGNAIRHGGARRVRVALETGRGVRLRVSDDGAGFVAPPEGVSPPGSYGLTGMRERAELLGGRLEIASGPGQGTEVCVVLP